MIVILRRSRRISDAGDSVVQRFFTSFRMTSEWLRMTRFGFTLLEVILAMTMLSVVLLAAANLDLAAARLTNATGGEVALRNNLLYAIRVMEKDIQVADEIEVLDKPLTPVESQPTVDDARYEFRLEHSDGSPDITYVIDLTPSAQAVATRNGLNLLPTGVTPKLKCPNLDLSCTGSAGANKAQSPFSVAFGKIVSLHFAAQSALPGGAPVLSASASKSILLRTAVVTGW